MAMNWAGRRHDWHERFAALPRPWTAVLVGGPTPQLAFGPPEAARMLAELGHFRGANR